MQRQRGFSLIEVLVAVLILGFVITTTLAAFVERTKRMREASETLLAYQALANETEVRRRLNFGELESAPKTFISDTTILGPMAPYTATVTTIPANDQQKNVTMTIKWHKGNRVAKLTIVRVDTGGANLW